MKAAVLGTGMIGTMIVREIAKHPNIESVFAVDVSPDAVDQCVSAANSSKVSGKALSLLEPGVLEMILEDVEVAVAALPHSVSMAAIRAAIASKCHLIDLVGSRYPEKAGLDEAAKTAGILVIPGQGVAPGIANVLAARGIELLDRADLAEVLCGGIPRHPLPPLWYQIVFRLESVIGLYTRLGVAVRDGKVAALPALSEYEEYLFPEPVGACEGVITDAHSMAYTLAGKVQTLHEKTLRYKGHYAKMGVLKELGFLDEPTVDVEGVPVSPRKLSMALLGPLMKGGSEEDITALRVTVSGEKDGRPQKHQWEMIDLYDHERKMTSMAKTTGFPAVIAVEWLAEGRLPHRGVVSPEEIFIGPYFDPFMEALEKDGIHIAYRQD